MLATGVCLPSFYFYGLLAGIRVSWLQVTAQEVLVLVPRSFLKPGRYRLLVYARGDAGDEPPSTFTLRVPAP